MPFFSDSVAVLFFVRITTDHVVAEHRYYDELYASFVNEILKVFTIKNDDFLNDELKENKFAIEDKYLRGALNTKLRLNN